MGNHVWKELEETARRFQKAEEETLFKLLQDNCNTEYGKKYHFSQIHSVEEFRKQVPITEYKDYIKYIERMMENNEENLIIAKPLKYYVMSSGTTGIEKYIPITEQGIIHYAKYTYQCAYDSVKSYYEKELNMNVVLDGKIFLINEIRFHKLKNGVKGGIISGALFEWMRERKIIDFNRYTSPEMVLFPEDFMDMAYLKVRFALECEDVRIISGVYVHQIVCLMKYLEDNWEMLVEDIEQGSINPHIDIPNKRREELKKYFAPKPERAEQLRKEFIKGFEIPIIPRIWKNICFIMAISGETFSKYMKQLKRYSGFVPYHYFVYGSSEGIFAPGRGINCPDEYIFAPKIGFYEFLPVNLEDDEIILEVCGWKDLQIGEKYELVYTGFSGFYRYRMGDIVEIKGFYYEAPIVKFCYRRKQVVNIAGEKMDMESIQNVIVSFEEKYNLVVNEFCIYPDEDVIPARYVILLELDSNQRSDSDEEERSEIIDELLRNISMEYDDCRNLREIGKPKVYFLKSGTFERYKKHLQLSEKEIGQYKPVRIIDTDEKKSFFFEQIIE